jgi:PERQ amino acid-rich with GYF domain-containing protein
MQLHTSDVNSLLKLPQQKEGTATAGGINGRKASLSHGSNYGVSSPSTASRPGTRRRETDTSTGLVSPSGNRFRDEWLPRKSLDAKEPTFEDDDEAADTTSTTKPGPFGGLIRANTSGAPNSGSGVSLWNATSALTSAAPTTGIGSFGSFAMAPSIGDRRLPSTRGESRLARLIPKEGFDNVATKDGDAPGLDGRTHWRSRHTTDVDPFTNEPLSGSAALEHLHDSPRTGQPLELGLSGLHIDDDGAQNAENNMYRSMGVGKNLEESGLAGHDGSHLGMGQDMTSAFGSLARGFPNSNVFMDATDRSQTASGGSKGMLGLNTLGGNALGGWPSEQPPYSGAWGPSLFSPILDLQSPSLGGMPSAFAPGPSGAGQTGSLRGPSKMGALFPPTMQAQMHLQHSQDAEGPNVTDSTSDLRQTDHLGSIGRPAAQLQDVDPTPMGSKILLDENSFPMDSHTMRAGHFSGQEATPGMTETSSPPRGFQSPSVGDGPPLTQKRTIVMPDRARWVYLDPQGEVQGPFTGLEMNDWYKANFFNADLRVKKVEDQDFEPLGQIIRRIGNSREPFLVPTMGIPHGRPAPTGVFGDRGVIPPLVGAFPSFGRTLTAEEQNNLERRKQEEQYNLARQREMAHHQNQAYAKIALTGGVQNSLHHHSSIHSLQSQPSFGSITSPLAQQQPPIGAMAPGSGFFDQHVPTGSVTQHGLPPSSGFLRGAPEQEDQIILAALQGSGTAAPYVSASTSAGPSGEGQSLLRGLPAADRLEKDEQGFSERLQQFKELRAQLDEEESARVGVSSTAEMPMPLPQSEAAQIIDEVTEERMQSLNRTSEVEHSLSLMQQVQNAQAAAGLGGPTEDGWAKPSTDLPMPFPPPQSQSGTPLPAPTAQRTRSTLPDQYISRSRSETPESATASASAQASSLAPWARETGEGHRGPSLKEIQEAEAKKAAKQEETAAAARRLAAEQEAALLREREKAGAANAPGLPTTSTWGNGSPVTPNSSSPWAKPAARGAPGLSAGPSTQNISKKTLADIQREEEARKQKARDAAAAAQASIPVGATMGKRYADLASKVQPPANRPAVVAPGGPPSAAGEWSTVGAGGKVKIPTGPAASRTTSTGNVKAATPAAARPVIKQTASVTNKPVASSSAMEEFSKWLHLQLSKGIHANIDGGLYGSETYLDSEY